MFEFWETFWIIFNYKQTDSVSSSRSNIFQSLSSLKSTWTTSVCKGILIWIANIEVTFFKCYYLNLLSAYLRSKVFDWKFFFMCSHSESERALWNLLRIYVCIVYIGKQQLLFLRVLKKNLSKRFTIQRLKVQLEKMAFICAF